MCAVYTRLWAMLSFYVCVWSVFSLSLTKLRPSHNAVGTIKWFNEASLPAPAVHLLCVSDTRLPRSGLEQLTHTHPHRYRHGAHTLSVTVAHDFISVMKTGKKCQGCSRAAACELSSICRVGLAGEWQKVNTCQMADVYVPQSRFE